MDLIYKNNLVYENYQIEYYGFIYIPTVGIQDDAIMIY